MQLRSLLSFAVIALACGFANAQAYKLKELRLDNPYARATVPGQPSGGAFLTIENTGKEADKLVAASSPVAKSVQIHTMAMEGNVMKMREVSQIELKPSEKLVMKPGEGYHVMLIGLAQPLKAGDKFPLTLTFEKAGKIEVSVTVQDRNKPMGEQGMRHGH
ncbi:MAG TPA: copper chaperone PCu(A)C [Noviherbaspirillum sp.]|uniref:copper chaperone PCu(A)C n=1 Tax=Noviherbaspirillum sp. TaxID=1926288 RepID=UPI002B49A64D|nr:copper chaperone PCu(A)C [Noviherbaspirillum sp.]HJV87286.1 copper chaperone PCu(A)C [Noviherbaspirillum sp.]